MSTPLSPDAQWFMAAKTDRLEAGSFELRDTPLPPAKDGQVETRTLFISLDPYLARMMKTWDGGDPRWAKGEVTGRVVVEVTKSLSPGFKRGDIAWGVGRWRARDIFEADALKHVPDTTTPPSLALGVLGASGLTAWMGIHLSGLKSGETLFVSAATGPVGSVAGQLAKLKGCRVIGLAGGPEKCAYAVDELGFDACIDHRTADLEAQISAAAPEGIHVLIENIGGPSLDPVMPNMVMGGRIMLCGLAAHYNSSDPLILHNFSCLLYRRLTLQPFITAEHEHLYPQALSELTAAITSGQISYQESLTQGLENAPATYVSMLTGAGIGKRLIAL